MRTNRPFLCPRCGAECERDEVDVGIGFVPCGPWGCFKADKDAATEALDALRKTTARRDALEAHVSTLRRQEDTRAQLTHRLAELRKTFATTIGAMHYWIEPKEDGMWLFIIGPYHRAAIRLDEPGQHATLALQDLRQALLNHRKVEGA